MENWLDKQKSKTAVVMVAAASLQQWLMCNSM